MYRNSTAHPRYNQKPNQQGETKLAEPPPEIAAHWLDRTCLHVFRDVADLRVNLLTMVNDCTINRKLANAMVSTATELEEEVIRVKEEHASLESPRMIALEARIKRLKGISPVRINDFVSELKWSRAKKEGNVEAKQGFSPLLPSGPVAIEHGEAAWHFVVPGQRDQGPSKMEEYDTEQPPPLREGEPGAGNSLIKTFGL
ncbi:hypothetical protein U1Q18_003395 [Sarracenia purpurea var. burkii]